MHPNSISVVPHGVLLQGNAYYDLSSHVHVGLLRLVAAQMDPRDQRPIWTSDSYCILGMDLAELHLAVVATVWVWSSLTVDGTSTPNISDAETWSVFDPLLTFPLPRWKGFSHVDKLEISDP